MVLKHWATRKLRSGDLTTLAAIAHGNVATPKEKCVQRLLRRHFITERENGRIDVTIRGHVALIIRRSMHN